MIRVHWFVDVEYTKHIRLEGKKLVSSADIVCTRSTLFFGSLPKAVFEAIVNTSRVVSLSHGETLFSQGGKADSVFVVLSGQIKLSVTQRDGNEVVVETFREGMSFAEAMAFENGRYPVAATALEASRILAAPTQVIRKVIRENPDAFDAILAATYRHLHGLVRQVEQLKSESGVERLGRYLLTLEDNSETSVSFELPFEKQTLASLLGMKPETLSRAFKRLQDHGVKVSGRKVSIEDRTQLVRFVERD